MKKRIGKRMLAIGLAVLLLLSLVGCSAAREVRASSKARKTVIEAGNIEVTYNELYFLVMRELSDLESKEGGNQLSTEQTREHLEKLLEEYLLNQTHALLSVAKDYGIYPDRGEVADSVQAYMESELEIKFGGDRDAYIDFLNELYLTDDYVRTYIAIEEDYLAAELIKAMLEKGKIDDSDEKALATINDKNAFIRTVQVLIKKNNGYSDEVNRGHAKELADSLRAITDKDKRYEAMCDAIGGEYNNDYGSTTRHGYYLARGEMELAYEEAAFRLENFDVSDVVETDEGYHIIMRLPTDDAYVAQNLESLKWQTYTVQLNDIVDQRYETLCESAEKTRFYESLDLLDLPAIDANGGETLIILLVIAGSVILAAGAVWLIRLSLHRSKACRKKK